MVRTDTAAHATHAVLLKILELFSYGKEGKIIFSASEDGK